MQSNLSEISGGPADGWRSANLARATARDLLADPAPAAGGGGAVRSGACSGRDSRR